MSKKENALKEELKKETGRVIAVTDDLIEFEVDASDGVQLMKNEVVYICPSLEKTKHERLKAEILRIKGNKAHAQVFEDTRGIAIGDRIEKSGEMLSITLGPGLLGQVFDGLQNPLEIIAQEHGFFLPRGNNVEGLDSKKKWDFKAKIKKGDTVKAGDVIGSVTEGSYEHKIFTPFNMNGTATIENIKEGSFTVKDKVCTIKLEDGEEKELGLAQEWPVRRPVPQKLYDERLSLRDYPSEPMVTTTRLIDGFFPVALGGTACIPGPFGAGKTVLQSLLSRYASVDIVIVVACGERAGEVVETITEFPEMIDPRTGRTLMERTIIICNTSSMPVAAREASIYTGITMGEYYRQMGYNVMLIADSTSRWAQALRETSGRLEEIPGEEAFPAYLDSSIKGLYERAGVIHTNDGSTGTLTMIGTVSPAGGNFEEPVTQSTLRTVKCFLGLSAARAYKRFFPAVDPLISWSRYPEQLREWYDKNMEQGWVDRIAEYHARLKKSDAINQMMQVTGEEGVTVEDFIEYQKGFFIDMIYLQQDAFDKIDTTTSLERQKASLDLIDLLLRSDVAIDDKDEIKKFFNRMTAMFKNLNYAEWQSDAYKKQSEEIKQMIASVTSVSDAA